MCMCNGGPERSCRTRTTAGCVSTEVRHRVITVSTRTPSIPSAFRPGRRGTEPQLYWARGCSLPASLRLRARPNPSAAGARRLGERRVSSRLRQETRTSLPHAPPGPTALPSSHKWNRLWTKHLSVFPPALSPFLLYRRRIPCIHWLREPKDNRSSPGLTFPVCAMS